MPKECITGQELHPSISVHIDNIDGGSVLYAQGYDGPVPMIGDEVLLFVTPTHEDDTQWKGSPKEKSLMLFLVKGRRIFIHKTPQAWEPRCTSVDLFVSFLKSFEK